MRLINPRLGELLDRLTILRLKVKHGDKVQHFQWEQREILILVEARSQWLPDSTRAQLEALEVRLAQVNAAIWESEDRVRMFYTHYIDVPFPLTSTDADAAAKAGFQSQQLNDQRSALIHEINVLTGRAQEHETEKAAR